MSDTAPNRMAKLATTKAASGGQDDALVGALVSSSQTASAFLFEDSSGESRNFEKSSPAGFYQLAICLQAHNGSLVQNGNFVRRGSIPRGGVNLYHAGEHIAVTTQGPWEMLVLFLKEELISEVYEQADLPEAASAVPALLNPRFAVDPVVLDASTRIAFLIRETGPFSTLRMDLAAQEAAIRLLSAHPSLHSAVEKVSGKGLAKWQLTRAYEVMNDSQVSRLSLAEIASAAGCSPSHFSRAFKASTGLPPFEWLLQRKIDRAKDLLREKGRPLSQIALEVGFAAQPQFTTAFHRLTGMTPGLWRKIKLQ